MFGFLENTSPSEGETYIICGLGNPGKEYEKTRHNVGFWSLDYLAEFFGVKWKRKWQSEFAEVEHQGNQLILLKPQTYMNASGEALKKCCKKNKVSPERVLVIYDDLALATGRLRIRLGGGSGGHNGIKSILSCLGGADFYRFRVGIDHPGKGADVAEYVLSDFTLSEKGLISPAANAIADAALMLCSEGSEAAMDTYNGTVPGVLCQPNQENDN